LDYNNHVPEAHPRQTRAQVIEAQHGIGPEMSDLGDTVEL